MNPGMRNTLASTGGAGGVLVAHLAGAPWYALTGCTVLLLVVIGVQSVFPQESADRLAWWKDRRRDRRSRLRGDRPPAALPPQRTGDSDPAATVREEAR